jgi:hypothetical protein
MSNSSLQFDTDALRESAIAKNSKQMLIQKSSINRQKPLPIKGFQRNTLLEEVYCGYGKCSYSGCYCQKYQGNASTCQNSGCGHSYGDHW